MESYESCKFCEKIIATFTSHRPIGTLKELPNTLDETSRGYAWVHHPMITYAMVPQSIHGSTGIVDIYACCDEDDLDDIDVKELAGEFLRGAILPRMKNISGMSLGEPTLAAPPLGCWKLTHRTLEEPA